MKSTGAAAVSVMLLVTVSSLRNAKALVTCNLCDSLSYSRCGTSLTFSPPTCTNTTCYIFTGTIDGRYFVDRDCFSSSGDGCTSVDTNSGGSRFIGTYCLCQTDYCNGGQWGSSSPTTTATTTSTTTTTNTTTTTPSTTTTTTMTPTTTTRTAPAVVTTVPRRLTCYKCDSLQNSQCPQSSGSGIATCENKMCYTFVGTVDGTNVVLRDCARSSLIGCSRVSYTSGGIRTAGRYCFCASNYCNRDAVEMAGNAVEIVSRGSFVIFISAAVIVSLHVFA